MTAYVLQEQYGTSTTIKIKAKLLNGHDILKTFGLEPGPRIGELLEALQEAQAAGEITDRNQAIDYIRQC
jgi:hypothetical protein